MNALRQKSLVTEFAYRLGYSLELLDQQAGMVHLRKGKTLIEVPVSLEMTEAGLAKQFGDCVSCCAKDEDIQVEAHIPAWLVPQLARREKLIFSDKRARFSNVDEDGKLLGKFQQTCESPFFGRLTLDSQRRKIIG
jgi:hypothetical protein